MCFQILFGHFLYQLQIRKGEYPLNMAYIRSVNDDQVGGLPLIELNHLELQFLILNDFRLAVPVEELEAYGTMLVSFYAREAVANANLHGLPPPTLAWDSSMRTSAADVDRRRVEGTTMAVPGG